MAMRKLKFHEKKLLRRVNFYEWKKEKKSREGAALRKYYIQDAEDYKQYNKTVGMIKKIANKLKKLDPDDPFRIEYTDLILNKLYDLGLTKSKKNLETCDRISATSFCRRRLPVIAKKLHFAENMKQAVMFTEQGHFSLGPNVVEDPKLIIPISMEKYITWTSGSVLKRKIANYHDNVDDFDLSD
ncbi:u3 small nucleolar ribonucleoprotein imp3 [Anaeramoeba flamelloides]|uniref:U3 small nucleolar ribonucleoprotein imp3 n=1 Tax=Anaeramoeba flamelloides TaxID=1746091 RepID=A0ABQ8Z288_9EUKA|nr:u3 small nucleolar ribonucleoprotein imp3 [Anaeramoeba flamelloides]